MPKRTRPQAAVREAYEPSPEVQAFVLNIIQEHSLDSVKYIAAALSRFTIFESVHRTDAAREEMERYP